METTERKQEEENELPGIGNKTFTLVLKKEYFKPIHNMSEHYNVGPMGPQGPQGYQGAQGFPGVDSLDQLIDQLRRSEKFKKLIEDLSSQGSVNIQYVNKEVHKETGLGIKAINQILQDMKKEGIDIDQVSDGWHTFKELYDFRLAYTALALNSLYAKEIHGPSGGNFSQIHKSWKHHDGEWCFGEEKKWFIVVAVLDGKPISNHYKAEHWGLFKIPEVEKSVVPYDGHDAYDVLKRIFEYIDGL